MASIELDDAMILPHAANLDGSNFRKGQGDDYLRVAHRKPGEFLFTGRGMRPGMTTRQYARLVSEWIASIGLDPNFFGTHSLRRTKATLIYRRTGNLRAVQLLLGHTKIESTVRYLGSRSMMPLPYRNKSMSDRLGQSGPALPD